MSHVTELREVRAHFGISQSALATWMGLGRAQIASIETEREVMPRHAWPWLRPWAAALVLPEPANAPALLPSPLPELLAPNAPAMVQARLAECYYQALRLHQQQATLLAGHRIAARRLAAGPLLLAALPTPVPAEATALALRRRWLARLLEEATDALAPEATAGPIAVQLLDARRRAWLHEAECLAGEQ